MLYYSTKNRAFKTNLRQAVLHALPPDGGLYMPESLLQLPKGFVANIEKYSFREISFEVARNLIGDNIPGPVLRNIVEAAVNFQAPLVYLDDYTASLELWHGPTLAFKDFGARFMSGVMSYLLRGENREHVVLTATSGDTGSAVASGFYQAPGIKVVILYPSGKVSPVQEKQLTTFGENITALEIEGTFDDCQFLVKKAFSDKEITGFVPLTSANSINIARLFPQCFYYFEAYKQIRDKSLPVTMAVPSGNFGNLTAGIIAKKMGLPVNRFIAATNINNAVPRYLQHGIYQPQIVKPTLSNAMDVGAPSNFDRILDLYSSTWNHITSDIYGYWTDDNGTRRAMLETYNTYGYMTDPHGAIAYSSLKSTRTPSSRIFLETAHPAKFEETIKNTLGIKPVMPEVILSLRNKDKISRLMKNDYTEFKSFLLS
jgi:threonine synthase